MKPKPLVDQPTVLPTRKMAAFAISSIVTAAVLSVTEKLAGASPWLDWLASADVRAAVPIVVGALIAYRVRDRAN